MVLIVIAPIVPYASLVLSGMPRFSLSSDLALTDYLIRHVWRGDILVGMPSRFHWSHPGPLFFFLEAPFVTLFGKSPAGLYVGVCFLVALEAAAIVIPLRLKAGRAHAVAAVVVLLAWFAAFGNVAANPWERLTITLPLVTFMVFAGLFATGWARAAVPAVFFGALAAETHIGTIPLVALVTPAAVFVFAVGRWLPVRRELARRDWISLALALGLAIVVSFPPLLEEWRHPGGGNITQLITFFRERTDPYKTFDETLSTWINVNAWLPDRVVDATIPKEGAIPYMMSWSLMPTRASQTATTILVIELLLLVVATIVAHRRKDWISISFIGTGLLGWGAVFYGIRSIIGEVQPSLVFWATAPSTVLWLGISTALFAAIAKKLPARHDVWLRRGGVTLALVCTLLVVHAQRMWLARFPVAPGSHTAFANVNRRLYETLREREAQLGFVPVVHFIPGDWSLVDVLVLEHDKDNADIRVADDWQWIYPGSRSAIGARLPLHVWIGSNVEGIPFAACLQRVATVDDIVIYGSETDPPPCASR